MSIYRFWFSTIAAALAATANAQEFNPDAPLIVIGVRSAEKNARIIESNKENLSSIIARDDFGNFVDQNIAESLRRLPGVVLQRDEGEGRFVTVRGLGPEFVTLNINGFESATADLDNRAFSLDLLTPDTLNAIEIYKTLTPDMNLNAMGGMVNVKNVSAFERNRDSLQFRLQSNYQEDRGEISPKFSLNGTRLLLKESLGIGFTLSYEERLTQVDEIRHHESQNPMFRQQDIPNTRGPTIIAPRQLENRQEIADRQRIGASLNLEYKARETQQFFFKLNHNQLTDEDTALREFFDFQDAGNGDTAYVNSSDNTFVVSDIDVFHQYFVQETSTTVSSLALGAEHLFANALTLDYAYAHSAAEFDSPNRQRVQFRERDLVVMGRGGADFIHAEIIRPERGAELGGFNLSDYNDNAIGGNANTLSNFQYDNLFLEDSLRSDTLNNLSANLRYDFHDIKLLDYIKTGLNAQMRKRERDKNRASFNPTAGLAGCNENAECLANADSNWLDYPRQPTNSPNFTFPFITREAFQRIVASTQGTANAALGNEISVDSTKDDYSIDEDTYAAYFMTKFGLLDNLRLMMGLRYEYTQFSSSGFFSIENDDFTFNGSNTLDIAVPMQPVQQSYGNFFPSLHLNWQASDSVLYRAALWTSYSRPAFNQAVAQATIDEDIELCVPGTRENNIPGTGDCDDSDQGGNLAEYELARNTRIQLGNPNLSPITATHFDLSLSWYESDELFMQFSFFYKAIQDFIVNVAGDTLAIGELPVSLPTNQVTQFTIPENIVFNNVEYATNGDTAHVLGLELSYVQYFRPGFFVQSNATLINSEAQFDNSLRAEATSLPGQADISANLVLGWENNTFSASLINHYQSEVLERIGACPAAANPNNATECLTWADRYQAAIFTVDAKLRYTFSPSLSIYLDILNLSKQQDRRYFTGNQQSGGELLYQLETYGRSAQLGITFDL